MAAAPTDRSERRDASVVARWAAAILVSAACLGSLVAVSRRAGRTSVAPDAYGETRVEGDGFPKVLANGNGRQVLRSEPRRIASLTVSGDEILTALVDPARLVAVSRFADDPSISMCAGRVPRSAARILGMDPESIVALEPEIVFVAHYTLDYAVRLLTGAGVPVVRFRDVRSYVDVEANVRMAAHATGTESRGEALIAEMNERLSRISARVSRLAKPRVLYYSPVNYTTGKDTLIDEKIRRAGGLNAAADFGLIGFDSVALDVLLSLNPDVVVVPRWSTADAAVEELIANPAWKEVPALRSGRVYAISASALTSQAPDGVLGVEELGRLLHPEAFSS